MRLLRILIVLLASLILSCKQQNSSNDEQKSESLETEKSQIKNEETQEINQQTEQDKNEISEFEELRNEIPEINEIDKQVSENKDSIIVLVKIAQQNELVRVINRDWPENIERTFNIFKNQQGQIIRISEFPTSESGDWSLRFQHYFADSGQLIAFEKNLAFFNGQCLPEGVTFQDLIELYDSNFKVVKTILSLTDSEGNKLDEKECGDVFYGTDYKPQPTVKDFVELKGIKF